MRTSVVVIPSTTAISGSDTAVTSAGIWNIKGVEPINRHSEVISATTIQAPVAPVAAVQTLTPTAAASTEYSFTITQYNVATKQWITQRVSYVSLASGDTATTISNKIKLLLTTYLSLGFDFTMNAAGAATVIITATTSNPVILITGLSAELALSVGTAGVFAKQTAAWITANYPGVTVETGATYGMSTIVTAPISKADAAGNLAMGNLLVILFVNILVSGYATFETAYNKVVQVPVLGDVTSATRIG